MFITRILPALATSALLLIVLLIFNPIACSSSSTTTNPDGSTTFTVSNLGQNISLTSGEMKEISFPVNYDLDSLGGPFSSLRMDLQAHLSAVSITVPGVTAAIPFPLDSIKTAQAAVDGGQLYLRVGTAEQIETVCEVGELYGPFSITLADNFQPESVSPAEANASQQTLDVINTGSYSICVQIMPSVTAVADLNSLIVDMESCREPPADISGTWYGSYECIDICYGTEIDTVELVIEQNAADPTIASYTDDANATYEGRVCGNRFSFTGGLTDSYDESGTFVLNADGSASKTSTYIDIGTTVICSGTCTDILERI